MLCQIDENLQTFQQHCIKRSTALERYQQCERYSRIKLYHISVSWTAFLMTFSKDGRISGTVA
jgi:hypothetical protein